MGLITFKCKCENTFCTKCRIASDHNCTFDYKLEAMTMLKKENPKIVADKVNKV